MATSIGARLRYQLDHDSDTYKVVLKQRTATERINSQAVELGIERPKLTNAYALSTVISALDYYFCVSPSAALCFVRPS
jgi:hypothetical protein